MQRFFFLCLILLLRGSAYTQDVAYLVSEGQQLEKAMKDDEALKKYQEALGLAPNDLRALVRTSLLTGTVSARLTDRKQQAAGFEAARTYAASALRADSNDADANCAMAIACGRLAMVSSVKEKAALLRSMKDHADTSLRISPDHARANHTLGKWHYEVTKLNMAEKTALKVLYGGLPPASMEQAVSRFEKVRALEPSFVLNYLDLARACKENGRSDKAIEVLTRMQKLPPKTTDDAGYKAEGKKLLESLM